MSKFSIIPNGGGTARYSGCPTYTGTYMKPGMLEFREISSPTPIEWEVGDYVAYTRTGFTYRLYGLPQVKKQARSTEYGGAFVYQSVQFFDDTKQLEICPFRDLVPDDNRIHFSTQPSISVFDNVAGIAERLQECLVDMYGANSWVVRVATENGDHIPHELAVLMSEDRDFSVSGVNILECLDKIYEIWPDVGWVFKIENVGTELSPVLRNTIVIGGAGLSAMDSYEYGKGNGLKSITRVVANADEMATRIFAYGSSRNMLPRWYNSQDIKDDDSVDIQNLMIPISYWGKTLYEGELKPDAAKAFIDAPTSVMNRLGLRPKTYYFDGTGDLPEIYPTIREMTIDEVRAAKEYDTTKPNYPKTTIYTNPNQRVDTVLSAPSSFDSGLAGDTGKQSVDTQQDTVTVSATGTFDAGTKRMSHVLFYKSFTIPETGRLDMRAMLSLTGSISFSGSLSNASAKVHMTVAPVGMNSTSSSVELMQDGNSFVFGDLTVPVPTGSVTAENGVMVACSVEVVADASDSNRTYTISTAGNLNFSFSRYRAKTFTIGIRQIGFNIEEQANLGDGKTIAMRSGKCAGRSFTIKSCSYVESTDSWLLEVIRSQDDSLNQWFPNTDYPIVANDEFVLLDIAMPDEYILVAENRLLDAARELLDDVSVERWQYTPEIDAKFMVENSRTLVPAQNMVLTDSDIVGGSPVSILIDTVTISEGEAAIPTYKVTLRDRKKKTFTEAKGAEGISSNPVTNATQESVAQMSSRSADSYFTLDANGNITLKEQYDNLWVPGWLSAGGVGTGGGGGGGGATWLSDLQDVGISSPQPGHILMYDPTQAKPWVNVPQSEITPDLSGYVPTTRTVNGHALSSNVTVTASDVGLGLVENVAISGWHGSTNITTLGTITTGTWSGTPIANSKLANSSMNIAGANVSLGGTLSSTSLKSNLGINTIESEIAKFNSWFSEDSNGNIFVNPKNGVARGFFTAGFLASGGFGESGGGSGSGGNDVAWGTSTQDSVQLTVDSVTFNLSKAGVTDHFSGYIGSTDSNQSIVLSSLEEYTDQSGRVSLTLGSASYLWVCLERDEFTIESEGIKVPMQYITTQSNVNCYVSAERLNAGVVNFVIKYDKIAKPDSEALVITARSYTITYGDALPDFSYTANGQVDGTPQITCSATSSSGAGTYAIVITRGTVTDANAVYENGTLTIAKANLIITADDKSIQLNGTMPTFTVSYSGFVHGETQRVLTTLPTCTTNAQGTSTAGRYDIIPSGAVATNYSFTYVSGHLYIGYTILISWTSTQVSAAKSIGGYIAADTGKLMTSSVYYGTVIAVDGYQGCNVNFTRANGVSFFRYAFLKTCDSWVQGNTPNYSSQSGYTSQIQVNAASGEAEIPSDAKYMYVYIYSNGTNYAPSIEISGISNSKTIFLAASNFTANKTISADGTIYTGANAPTVWCTTNQLAIKGATFNYGLSALASHIPSQFDSLEMNIAAYNATKAFTQRYTYKRIPATYQLAPGECYVHIMMIGIKNGSAVNISSVPIGDNDVQLIVKDE